MALITDSWRASGPSAPRTPNSEPQNQFRGEIHVEWPELLW
jgi:hypothetical protein